MLDAIREVQIPLLAALLLGGCVTKLARTLRTGSVDDGLGPTALFPMSMRRPLAMTMCAIEFGLGVGLILTAGSRIGAGPPATCVRLGAVLLFLVATSALIELRTDCARTSAAGASATSAPRRSAAGPWPGRRCWRSSALVTLGLPPIRVPHSATIAVELIAILTAELLVIGALSPEVGEGLIRLGYSEPCELRDVPSARTLAALRRSKQWRRYSGRHQPPTCPRTSGASCAGVTSCTRPSSTASRADLVFAVYPAAPAPRSPRCAGRRRDWPADALAGVAPRDAPPGRARRRPASHARARDRPGACPRAASATRPGAAARSTARTAARTAGATTAATAASTAASTAARRGGSPGDGRRRARRSRFRRRH